MKEKSDTHIILVNNCEALMFYKIRYELNGIGIDPQQKRWSNHYRQEIRRQRSTIH